MSLCPLNEFPLTPLQLLDFTPCNNDLRVFSLKGGYCWTLPGAVGALRGVVEEELDDRPLEPQLLSRCHVKPPRCRQAALLLKGLEGPQRPPPP